MKITILALLILNVHAIDLSILDNSYVIKNTTQDTNESHYILDDFKRAQLKEWYKTDIYNLQKNYTTDFSEYISLFNAGTFNEAKKNYYSGLSFSNEKRFHLAEQMPVKEWGFLNHPPVHNRIDNLEMFSKNYRPINYKEIEHPFLTSEFQIELDRETQTELTFNNDIELLENTNSYLKKVDLIKNAKEEILISTLSFVCDESVKVVVNELIAAKNRGVKVYAMDDSFASKMLGHSECPKKLIKAGVHFIRANDFFKYNGRTIYHHKKLIVDSKFAVVGGLNMLNADNLSNGTDFKNKDIDILLTGPIVTDISIGFIKDWQHFRSKKKKYKKRGKKRIRVKNTIADLSSRQSYLEQIKLLDSSNMKRGKAHYDTILGNKETRMNGVCRFIQQSPYEDNYKVGRAYLKALAQTTDYLGVMDPIRVDTYYKSKFFNAPLIEKFDDFKYFNKIHFKIKDMQERGMNIDFITTGTDMTGNEIVDITNEEIREIYNEHEDFDKKINKKISKKLKKIRKWNNFFGVAHFKNLINDYAKYDNTNVWLHLSFLHSKVFYFDRIMSSIGSYNFQHNATDHSYENTIFCLDEKLNKRLDEVFVRDMANSVPLVYKEIVK